MGIGDGDTRERILLAALGLFSEHGIAKTSLAEVAQRAGLTRVTVYRHFANKQELVRQAYLRVEGVFVEGLKALKRGRRLEWDVVSEQIAEGLGALPREDVFARADELKRLYPVVYRSIQQARTATLGAIFDRLWAEAERHHRLRPGLDRRTVKALFWGLLEDFFTRPRLASVGLSGAEWFRAVSDVLLYGVLVQRPAPKRRPRP